ncbi:hypothetical protein [Flavobacterium sp.]|uniref:hypothetical protein n=1 Tax=Flavobacterium sp. TaxID=239 RepID=UPI0022C6DAD1|nr:hypothetical protein [Flavobacterium sp.]MCZ8227746.1 hypothetical protein [Flavobacterium sp.]
MNFLKKIVYIFIFITSSFSFGQKVRVIDNKGTIKEVDNSKWSTSGNDIYNKNSGNIGIGATPDASAKLEVKSTTSGFLPPRLTTLQRDAIVLPATGLVVFNLTTNALEINNGTNLVPVWTSSFTPDATTTSKGILQLAGDLAGIGSTATNPVISNSAISTIKLADNAVTTLKIADANVTNAKLATDAVTTGKILDGTIIGADLANSIITNAKLAETISVPNGGTGATTLTGYVKGNGTNAMTAVATIPVADIVGAQTTANLASNITANTGSTTLYPSVAAVEAYVTNSATPDATSTVKGKVKLAGDLGGTADLPTVPGLATKEPTIAAGTTTQYWRGDKTWQTLDKSTVGLSNVDNTSDTNKPISTATQTALNNKEDVANKSTNTALGTSNVLYPTQNAVKTYVDAQITSNSTPDATTTVKGKIQLAGDLGGTAAAPSVVKLQGTAVSATTPTTGQLLQFDGTNWKPVNANIIVKMETDEFVATAAQVSFTLTATPIGKIAMYVNGVRVPKAAITVTGTTVAYTSSSNGGYVVLVNDRITFDYITN